MERFVSMNVKIIVVILMLSCALSVSGTGAEEENVYDDDDGEPAPRPEDIPQEFYDSLMEEIPELRDLMVEFPVRRKSRAYKPAINYGKPYPSEVHTTSNISKKGGRRVYQHYPWGTPRNWDRNGSEIAATGSFLQLWMLYTQKKTIYKSNCYCCGLNVSYFVPTNSICHDAFESQNSRMRALQRFFRGKCYHTNAIWVNFTNKTGIADPYKFRYFGTFQGWNNMIYGAWHYNNSRKETHRLKWGWGFRFDYGLKRNFFGQYTGGCFKRYLDVGKIYTQRGCRHYWPLNTYGGPESDTFMHDNIGYKPVLTSAHRFKKLEYLLRWKKEGCISSSHASLTPFNRGISLYARYYVCVCEKRYCNRVANSARLNGMLLYVPIAILLRYLPF